MSAAAISAVSAASSSAVGDVAVELVDVDDEAETLSDFEAFFGVAETGSTEVDSP